jgi:hypothetical protein
MTIFNSIVAAAERTGSEHSNQVVLFAWAAESGIPELKWLFAIPNGFYATPAQKAKMKAEGLRSGVSDIMLPISKCIGLFSYMGLFIELKTADKLNRKNGGLSDEQVEFGRFVIAQGYKFVVCYSWQEAKDAILNYLGRSS